MKPSVPAVNDNRRLAVRLAGAALLGALGSLLGLAAFGFALPPADLAPPRPGLLYPPFVAEADGPDPQELQCLAVALYHEARGEPEFGRRMVARVILHRRDLAWRGAESVCDVVSQPRQITGVDLLGLAPPDPDNPLEIAAWASAQRLAWQELEAGPPRGFRATHYYAHEKVDPYWAAFLDCTTIIGAHTFCEPSPGKT